MKMIKITDKTDCCGCGACAQVCPKNCISMRADSEGFLYPAVETENCIECGLCRQVCPVLQQSERKKISEIYAAYALNEEIREDSSSGGIFSLLANSVLEARGVVFGAAFDEDFSVHHIKVESAADMYKLRGSKYLQSRTEMTYAEAKCALDDGKTVLFSGVSCQIAGLKSYLTKDYENLYTVDVLCHGVPSPEVWERYLQTLEEQYGSGIHNASFRSKKIGWHDFASELHFQDASVYCRHHNEDLFMQCFLRNICLRPSCHSCKFREGRSGADITLGDAWGIQNWMPELDDDRGTSIVLINSEKGRQMWLQIAEQTCSRQGDPEIILQYNSVYRKSVAEHPGRARFFASLAQGASMKELAKLSRKPLHRRVLSFGKRALKFLLKKIGIL